ncbi:MAG: GNAT family N-acetyltransferase [Steroidobacteraceae bacterium]|nr:GNAT family N-acetyltransferase [Steroidobacteraceae bacterium]
MHVIRAFLDSDWPEVWELLRETIAAGDTYSFAPDSAEADIRRIWIDAPAATFVARDADGALLGTYFIKANQPGLGDHVCNCGYVVAARATGRGMATAMCKHSQTWASDHGFRAMQFNFVVSTNERAVRLWERLGFQIVGRLPGAFRHRTLGYVDALVMYKTLYHPAP